MIKIRKNNNSNNNNAHTSIINSGADTEIDLKSNSDNMNGNYVNHNKVEKASNNTETSNNNMINSANPS